MLRENSLVLCLQEIFETEEAHLDLVEVAPKAKPPVCRIMDFGKYRYEQQKREKEAKKTEAYQCKVRKTSSWY